MVPTLQKRLLERENPAAIHLIGVAGSGMSGLALMLLEMGHKISGSDKVTSDETERLKQLGLDFSSPHAPEKAAVSDIVIYSSAIKENDPTLTAARERNIPCLLRAQCLAAILNNKKGIVVAGTHGKTTTSALTAHLLREGRQRPCHYVGAEIPVLGNNAHWNELSDYLVAEGDESDGTLVNYLPEHSIILNIEEEHLDFYRNLDEIKEVFHRLCEQTTGKIFYCSSDNGATDVCSGRANGISYGWANADFTATEVTELRGRTLFVVNKNEEPLGRVELGIPGRHNVLNALAAIAVAIEQGVDMESIARGLSSFAGARRRFETKFLSPQCRIVDDYGHHPTEIEATLCTARSLHPERLVVLFQPHRYTRTKLLAREFGKAFQIADLVFVTDIYPASEQPIPGISGQTIVDAIHNEGPVESMFLPDLETAHHIVGNALRPGDLLITLGAGNVHVAGTRLAHDLAILDDLIRFSGMQRNEIKLYEPMRKHTTIKVGGPAQFWCEPSNHEAFRDLVCYCRDRGLPVTVVGRGSNLIVRNGGLRGAVICLHKGCFSDIKVDGDLIAAGAGVRLKKLSGTAQAAGLSGFEWMDGIPGNVGGSLRMNAGAMGNECIDTLVSVTCLDERGEFKVWEQEELACEYRSIPEFKVNFVLEAVFRGKRDKHDQILKRMLAGREKRKQSQPIAPSAGCIFKNPPGFSAGKLIDDLGLKGTRIGDAEISPVHGNFIVNEGNASAVDVLALVDLVKDRIYSEHQLVLETEAQIIGDRDYTF